MPRGKLQSRLWVIRERLFLDAAERILATKGCRGFSTEELARTVGVGKGTVYAHRPSQSAWVEAVLSEVGARLLPFFLRSETGSPPDRLIRAVSHVVGRIVECPAGRLGAPCCLRTSPCPYNGWAAIEEPLRRWIEEGLRTGTLTRVPDPELAARALHHLLSAATPSRHNSRAVRRKVLDWVLRGYLTGLLGIREATISVVSRKS